MPADPQPDVLLNTPAPDRAVGSSVPPRIDPREGVGPDRLTADQRAWIQEGHDYYDRLDAARDAGARLLW